MKKEIHIKVPDASTVTFPSEQFVAGQSRLSDYWELTKPRLTFLVLVTTFVGFCMGSHAGLDWILLFHTMIATALVAAGAAVVNQFLEVDQDSQMKRTEDRPLPSGRLQAADVLLFGVLLSVIGLLYLLVAINLLTSLLAVITLCSYLFVYTPLKKKTPLCTIVGAIPGAIPPMMGWSAARNSVDAGAWVLFAILFFWQMPHFYALAQIYREDYARAGFPMLSVVDPEGGRVAIQIISHTFFLFLVSTAPTLLRMTGKFYLVGALILSLTFIGFGVHAAIARSPLSSKKLFLASIFYLPLLLILMVADKM